MKSNKCVQAIFYSVLLVITSVSCKDEVVKEEEMILFIESPHYKSTFEVGEPILFSGTAGTGSEYLTGSELVWTSSSDGIIGYGESFTRDDLSEGIHEITLTAVSEAGETVNYSIPIEVFKKRARRRERATVEERHIRVVIDPVDGGIYINADDGTIVDMTTGLMWEKSPDNQPRNFKGAMDYAKNLKLSGYNDWRLPTIEELQYITNLYLTERKKNAAKMSNNATMSNGAICNVFDTISGHFWVRTPKYTKIGKWWYANTVKYRFNSGNNYFYGSQGVQRINRSGYVRCVRKCNFRKWKNILAEINN
jgi:hypothetical protein